MPLKVTIGPYSSIVGGGAKRLAEMHAGEVCPE
jgi:hypothetical protein